MTPTLQHRFAGSGTTRHRGLALLLAPLMIASTLVVIPDVVRADSATVMGASLHFKLEGTSAVWTGEYAYVFGGSTGSSLIDRIERYDPSSDSTTLMGAKLPAEIRGSSAIWTGEHAYMFGGRTLFDYTPKIVRYDPQTDTATLANASLPGGRYLTSAVWDGRFAYVFGGCNDGTYLDQIVRYDPTTDAVRVMNATLPTGRSGTSAVWTGDYAYVLGGNEEFSSSNQIVRYGPRTDTTAVMNATLPYRNYYVSAVWDGAHAFLFGKCCSGNRIVRYNPAIDTVSIMSATLPSGFSKTSAIWDGVNVYVFGGRDSGSSQSDKIVRYNLSPASPQDLVATAGAGAGEISLAWVPPADNTYSVLSGYRIYRSNISDGPYALIAEVGNTLGFVDAGLPNGVTRFYRVSGVNAGTSEGPHSGTVSATTFTPPTAPRDLNAGPGIGVGEVTLDWLAPGSTGGLPVTSYRVYRGTTSGGPYTQIGQAPGDQTTYTDTDRVLREDYFYVVAALNDAGESPESNEASAPGTAPPPVPSAPNPKVQENTDGSVTVYDDGNENDEADAGEALATTHPTFFSESFDSGDAPGWSLTGLWHVTGCRSASATHSLGYNRAGCPTNFDVGATTGSATTLPIEVPLAAGPVFLTWRSWHDTEGGFVWDQKKVLVSDDGGATWDILWQEDGPKRAWNARSVDLTTYAGKTMSVRFHFDSRSATANTGEGWYVDDVRVANAAGALA